MKLFAFLPAYRMKSIYGGEYHHYYSGFWEELKAAHKAIVCTFHITFTFHTQENDPQLFLTLFYYILGMCCM